jgi:hypothetical protein
MYFIVVLPLVEPAAQLCALDRSSYSRRAQKKSTAEANYFYFNVEGVLFTFPEECRIKPQERSRKAAWV